MDPNLFNLDEGRLFEVLFAITTLSFLLERMLSILFGWKYFVERFEGKGVKEVIAFIVCATTCVVWEFDAFSILFVREKMTIYGEIMTGAIVAGGSKASVALFRDYFNLKTKAEKDMEMKRANENV